MGTDARAEISAVVVLPDERLQNGWGGTLLKFQLLVVKGLGIRSTFCSSFPQEDNAVIISQWQWTLGRSICIKSGIGINKKVLVNLSHPFHKLDISHLNRIGKE